MDICGEIDQEFPPIGAQAETESCIAWKFFATDALSICLWTCLQLVVQSLKRDRSCILCYLGLVTAPTSWQQSAWDTSSAWGCDLASCRSQVRHLCNKACETRDRALRSGIPYDVIAALCMGAIEPLWLVSRVKSVGNPTLLLSLHNGAALLDTLCDNAPMVL